MSLNWDLTGCKDNGHEDYWSNPDRCHAVTEALIWHTLVCEVSDNGKITAENAPEFFARVYARERIRGVMVRVPNADGSLNDRYIEWADVAAHVGMYTNVFPKTSRPGFVTSLAKLCQSGGLFRLDPDPRPLAAIKADILVALATADEILSLEASLSS